MKAAASRPYTTARLMMTSMSYSRCFKIAIASAAGTPNNTTAASSKSTALATGALSQWQAASAISATTLHAGANAAVNANHLIC